MTRSEHFEILPEEIRQKAIANTNEVNEEDFINDDTVDKIYALSGAFIWDVSKEGHDYWSKIHQQYFTE